jgi:hypothetical protein
LSAYLVCKVELLADRKSFVIGDVKSRETMGILCPRAIAALSERYRDGGDQAEMERGGERVCVSDQRTYPKTSVVENARREKSTTKENITVCFLKKAL